MTTDASDIHVSNIDPQQLELKPGTKVGEYEVERKLGEGGFGAVYKAIHPLIGKVVAIKVLARQYSVQPDIVSRFIAEARAVNQIRNRNIIDIFAFGSLDDGRHYYVMEYLDGMALESYIHERGCLGLDEAIPILRAVARALDAAHAKGIAHRDLKPDNVYLLIGEDGSIEPKLLDFGIAKLLSDENRTAHKTKTGAPIGTPYYMSPEQCRGRDVDHRTDIYAFGVMSYRMLTGSVPFDGDYMDILIKQINEQPEPPSQRVPALPASVDHAIAWMMQKDPAARPPSLTAAVHSLEDAARDAGIALPAAPMSGIHAALATPVQGTPGLRTPMPRTPVPRAPSNTEVGLAGTLDAGALPPVASALPPVASAVTSPGSVPRASHRKAAILGLAVLGVVAAGIGAFVATSGSSADQVARPAEQGAPPAEQGAPAAQQPAAVPEPPSQLPPEPMRPPERPAFVTVTIEGAPDGTEVYGPNGLVGVAPGKIQLARGQAPIILTFKASEHAARSLEVVPGEDLTLTVELERKRRKRSQSTDHDDKNSRDTIEDPFSSKP